MEMIKKSCCQCIVSKPDFSSDQRKGSDLFQLIDDRWWCREHASSFLEKEENRLIYSPNRETSITEQRMLDQVRVLKARVKRTN